MENLPDEFEKYSDLEAVAYSSIGNLLSYFVKVYGDRFESDTQMNKFFVRILASVLGDMLAHFDEQEKESVTNLAYDQIVHVQDLTEAYLSSLDQKDSDAEEAVYDLNNMKPMGNA